MVVAAAATYVLGGPAMGYPILWYMSAAFINATLAVGIFGLMSFIQVARSGADKPGRALLAKFADRADLLLVAVLILPIFLGAYTTAKSAIPVIVGFRFDGLFADLDATIFGVDPWQLTHALFNPAGTAVISLFYTFIWIALLGYIPACMALFANRRLALTYYTALTGSWFVGGFVIAFLVPAAGPSFLELSGLEWRFAELRLDFLLGNGADSKFIHGPAWLTESVASPLNPAFGGGVSAMPSMHMATSFLYIFAARGTKWAVPAWVFAAIILVGSVHSGYHYFVDSLVAWAVAAIAWSFAEARLQRRSA